MTTVEAGVAIGQPGPKHEERATAIHEAGHAVCSHVYMENLLVHAPVDPQARTTRRPPPGDGGSRTASAHWRSEEVGDLIWGLGAMAAELVFYGQNTDRRRRRPRHGDRRAAQWSASPAWRRRRSTSPTASPTSEEREKAEKKVMERFEELGTKLMHRSARHGRQRFRGRAGRPDKRKLVAGLLGQAFVSPRDDQVNKDGDRADRRPPRSPRRRSTATM